MKSTQELENEISKLETKELKNFLKENQIERKTFGDRLVELCDQYGVTTGTLQKNVAISKQQFYSILNGTRNPSKETVLKVALTLKITLDETNELLKLAKHKELYPKIKDDTVIIFGIKNKKDIGDIQLLLTEIGSKMNLVDRE